MKEYEQARQKLISKLSEAEKSVQENGWILSDEVINTLNLQQ